MKVSAFLAVVALAAGISAAAQSTTPPAPAKPAPTTTQAPAKPPAPTTPTQTPAGQPPDSQTPAAQTLQVPAPPSPAVPASRKFTAESGIMFSLIYANKTADFEAVLARVKEGLAKSQDPKRKQQALSWRVLKGVEPGPGGNIFYVWFFDPAVKDVEYSITSILTEAFPTEAQDLWAKYFACFATPQSMLNLQQVLTMGPAGTVTVPK